MTEDEIYFYFKASERVQLSEHFSTWEFRDKALDVFGEDTDCKVSKGLLERLELLRSQFGDIPITVTSGFRSDFYNNYLIDKGYKASRKSQHLLGKAVDITCQGLSLKKMYDIARKGLFKNGGVGIYNDCIHVDVRGHKARWDYRRVK